MLKESKSYIYVSDNGSINVPYNVYKKIDCLEPMNLFNTKVENVFRNNGTEVNGFLLNLKSTDYNKLFSVIDVIKNYKKNIKILSSHFDIIKDRIYGDPLRTLVSLSVTKEEMLYNIIKRIIDLGLTFLVLSFILPMFLIIAIIIKLSSRGPVFFAQERIGKNGKIFKIYKFRTMYEIIGEDLERKKMMMEFIKNDNNENKNTKIVDEKRITKIGKILRKTSLDELPQLFNVLKGEMSLVGPRPELEYTYDSYEEWQKRRVSVLPGCTGIWQVYGRSTVGFRDSIIMDLYYVYNKSILLDFYLMIKTIPVIFLCKGGN